MTWQTDQQEDDMTDQMSEECPSAGVPSLDEAHQYVSRYSIPIVPEGHRLNVFSEIRSEQLMIERTGPDWMGVNTSPDTWKIVHRGSRVWKRSRATRPATNGSWQMELSQSNRTEDWFRLARFPLAEAWSVARAQQPVLLADLDRWHGARADEALAEEAQEGAEA